MSDTATMERPTNGAKLTSALAMMASRYNVSQDGLIDVIKKTCIKGNASDAEFKAFVMVANQYRLNPLTKEIHAFANGGAIVPIIGIDGWTKIVNEQDRFDGCEFEQVGQGDEMGMTCIMYVKGRTHPIKITEWLSECKRNSAPWNTMKRRMLRHKAFIQAARLAFSLSGIYDEDEAKDIIQNTSDEQPARQSMASRVTNKPIPEGKTFVLDLDAAEQIARQDSAVDANAANAAASEPQPDPKPAETSEGTSASTPGGENSESEGGMSRSDELKASLADCRAAGSADKISTALHDWLAASGADAKTIGAELVKVSGNGKAIVRLSDEQLLAIRFLLEAK